MRKLKRNGANRAFQRGYYMGVAGKSRDRCPHEQGDHRAQWLAGWREGRQDCWEASPVNSFA